MLILEMSFPIIGLDIATIKEKIKPAQYKEFNNNSISFLLYSFNVAKKKSNKLRSNGAKFIKLELFIPVFKKIRNRYNAKHNDIQLSILKYNFFLRIMVSNNNIYINRGLIRFVKLLGRAYKPHVVIIK